MADLVRKRKAYIKTETTYGSEAGSTDGSDMTYVDAFTIGPLNDGKTVIETPQASGRFWQVDNVAGPDGGTVDITTPLIGLNGAPISGSTSPADDWLDIMLRSVFNNRRQPRANAGLLFGSSSILVGHEHQFALQDVIAVYAVNQADPDRCQPVLIHSASGVDEFAYAPALEGTPPVGSLIRGFTKFEMSDSGTQDDRSFTMTVCQDASFFTLKGCRPTALSINVPVGGNAECQWSIGYDSKTDDTAVKTALPTVTRRPFTPIQGFVNGFWFAGTKYPFRNMNINFNLRSQNISDQSKANGRGSINLYGYDPEITVEPLFSSALLTLKRAQTAGRLMLQLGSGISGSAPPVMNLINMVAISCNAAQISKADPTDDENVVRHSISIRPVDTMVFSGSSADFLSLTRF